MAICYDIERPNPPCKIELEIPPKSAQNANTTYRPPKNSAYKTLNKFEGGQTLQAHISEDTGRILMLWALF